MSTMRSQDEIRNTVVSLGLPEHPYFMRRTARAIDLLDTGKVNFVGDDIFRVHSQFDDQIYHVELNHGLPPRCDCADHQKNPGVACKHIISSRLYLQRQAKSLIIKDVTEFKKNVQRAWFIIDGKRRINLWQELDGKLCCNCGAYYQKDCIHKQAIRGYNGGNGNGSKVVNECGTEQAKVLQDKLNGQLDSRTGGFVTADNHHGNGTGAYCAPSQPQSRLNRDDPFQEAEQNDIDQIEGRKNGELAWKLSNGEYCISYRGIMTLAEKHNIDFPVVMVGANLRLPILKDSKAVIAYAQTNGSLRLSGKPVRTYDTSVETVCELAKRNAARQLLPLPEIKAVEHKAKLTAEFSWQKAKAKCVELVGEANVDIIIWDLVNAGKLRQDNPSHYDRTEWLIIYDACKKDAESNDDDNNNDGGDNSPSSNNEDNPYAILAAAPINDNWCPRWRECVGLVGMSETDLIIRQELNFRYSYYKNKITDEQWDIVLQECRYRWNARQAKAMVICGDKPACQRAHLSKQAEYDYIRSRTGYDVQSKKYVGRPPLNDEEFIAKCKDAINKVRESKTVEANDQPLEGSNGKRKLQMDKTLRTWLIEADGTKKAISCREICEQFNDGSIVTRLRAGIDSGADISTVELDD